MRGQDAASKAGQLWKDSQAAFAAKDYATAASGFNSIIQTQAPTALKWADGSATAAPPAFPTWLDPAFFMLGASYFNMKDWPNAVTTFDRYLKLFPHSAHVAEITFSLGQAQLFSGSPQAAIPTLTPLLRLSVYHANVVALLADSYTASHDLPGAIRVMETELALPNLLPDYRGKLELKLLDLYQQHGDIAKAFALLQDIDAHIASTPDVTQFNALAAMLGDKFLDEKDVDSALSCYRRVRDNQQVIALEKLQIATLQRQRADNLARIQADPLNSASLQLTNKNIDTQVAKDQKTLVDYQTLPPILPPLLLRIGRAYSVAGQYWESAVVFRELRRRFPDGPTAEPALYGMLLAFNQVKQVEQAQALCHEYLTHYPAGKYADTVAYLQGVLAYDAEEFDQAVAYFKDCLAKIPNNPRREQIERILGDIQLQQAKFDDAIASYQKFETDFPNSPTRESAEYRSALALLFGGKLDQAQTAIQAYMQKYPDGQYVPDAAYRLMVIKFGSKKYEDVIADGKAWQAKYQKAGPLSEVLALMGDCYASTGRKDEALQAYQQAYPVAQTPDALSYGLFSAAKILQGEKRWSDIVDMFRRFLKANPDSPLLVESVVWIGRADVKLGKVDEARKFMADTAKLYLGDPSREAVDEILTQLAELYARRHFSALPAVATAPVPAASPAPAAPVATASPTTAPATTGQLSVAGVTAASPEPEPAADPAKGLVAILTSAGGDTQPTAAARLLYAQSELARLQHKADVEKDLLLQIAAHYKPEDLSPAMLAEVGDCLLQTGQPDQAATFYHEMLDDYPKSQMIDFAYNGLGQIAYDKKDYAGAFGYYGKALDKGVAAVKMKEITLGDAQTLLALGRYDEAKARFVEVASNRAWRGKDTAVSVYSLGEIAMKQMKYAEANAYYQRVFVAYQKYPDIQAEAYLGSGEAFEKLGQLKEAANTYGEMVRNPALASYPETEEARRRLTTLVQK